MARKVKERDLGHDRIPPTPKNPKAGAPMVARGGAHELHSVGPINGMGARTSMCRITGSFYEAPEGLELPRCVRCYGKQANG